MTVPAASATETITTYPELDRPEAFTQENIGWVPWLTPLPVEEFTDRHWEGVVDKSRAKSPYFALLARDPEILAARTKTDNDIFYNTKGGLPRAERELAATATSRFNGCVFCASVHSRFSSHYSKRTEDVQRLLDEGVSAQQDERWSAIIEASVALAATPVQFGPEHVARLTSAGLEDYEIVDVINGSAFFNWANRLMLSLGEPENPAA